MALAVISSLPVESHFVPALLEDVIDKKIAGVALNVLEKLIDWLCSYLYCPYTNLYRDKLQRVHHFSDQTVRMYDCTKEGAASLRLDNTGDAVLLNRSEVLFNRNTQIKINFSREANMDYVVVSDETKRKNWYQIMTFNAPKDHGRKPMRVVYSINANQVFEIPQVRMVQSCFAE